MLFCFFFFFKQKTAYEMRISDWSSDVCSSDLLASLAYERFIRSPNYSNLLVDCQQEVADFRKKYRRANIPEFERSKSLREIIGWALAVVKTIKPRVSWTPPEGVGQFELSLDVGDPAPGNASGKETMLPRQLEALIDSLEQVLSRAGLSLWLMIDRLDELFARRSPTERRADRKSTRLHSSH